jgi:hypothetical protein
MGLGSNHDIKNNHHAKEWDRIGWTPELRNGTSPAECDERFDLTVPEPRVRREDRKLALQGMGQMMMKD